MDLVVRCILVAVVAILMRYLWKAENFIIQSDFYIFFLNLFRMSGKPDGKETEGEAFPTRPILVRILLHLIQIRIPSLEQRV